MQCNTMQYNSLSRVNIIILAGKLLLPVIQLSLGTHKEVFYCLIIHYIILMKKEEIRNRLPQKETGGDDCPFILKTIFRLSYFILSINNSFLPALPFAVIIMAAIVLRTIAKLIFQIILRNSLSLIDSERSVNNEQCSRWRRLCSMIQ